MKWLKMIWKLYWSRVIAVNLTTLSKVSLNLGHVFWLKLDKMSDKKRNKISIKDKFEIIMKLKSGVKREQILSEY